MTQGCSCEPWFLVSWGKALAVINKRTVSWRLLFWEIVLPGQHMGCGKRDQGCIPCWQPNFSGKRAAGNAHTGLTPQTVGGWSGAGLGLRPTVPQKAELDNASWALWSPDYEWI